MNEFIESTFGFLFSDPWMLLIALAVPPVLWWRLYKKEPAAAVGIGGMLMTLPQTLRSRLSTFPALLQALGVLLLIIGLARPVVRERVPLRGEGIDILLVIDISSSMLSTDMDDHGQVSRIAFVKETARKFAKQRVNDRVGLLTFARFPELKCPLTMDHATLDRFIADTECVPARSEEDKTGIGLGLARAAQILRSSSAKSKVIVLLTDGQENVMEITPSDAAKLANDFKIKVYTIGAGSGERTLSLFPEVDFSELENIAKVSEGKFFRARDAEALAKTYETIDQLEKTRLLDPRYRYEEKFYYLAIPGLAAVVLALFLRSSVFATIP
ncbi:MAG: VWA domain-containing protein [Planctomycetota bacterium]